MADRDQVLVRDELDVPVVDVAVRRVSHDDAPREVVLHDPSLRREDVPQRVEAESRVRQSAVLLPRLADPGSDQQPGERPANRVPLALADALRGRDERPADQRQAVPVAEQPATRRGAAEPSPFLDRRGELRPDGAPASDAGLGPRPHDPVVADRGRRDLRDVRLSEAAGDPEQDRHPHGRRGQLEQAADLLGLEQHGPVPAAGGLVPAERGLRRPAEAAAVRRLPVDQLGVLGPDERGPHGVCHARDRRRSPAGPLGRLDQRGEVSPAQLRGGAAGSELGRGPSQVPGVALGGLLGDRTAGRAAELPLHEAVEDLAGGDRPRVHRARVVPHGDRRRPFVVAAECLGQVDLKDGPEGGHAGAVPATPLAVGSDVEGAVPRQASPRRSDSITDSRSRHGGDGSRTPAAARSRCAVAFHMEPGMTPGERSHK